MNRLRRRYLSVVASIGTVGLAGCSGSGPTDSDGDGMIDSEDYAPQDSDVQEKSDVSNGGSSQSGSDNSDNQATESGSSESSVNPHIGQVDVDVQMDIGTNNIGYDVEAYFEDTAVLTVEISDGERSDQRSFEGTTTGGTMQEFNDDINPPESFKDNEQFQIRFILSVDGETVDQKTFTHTYSE